MSNNECRIMFHKYKTIVNTEFLEDIATWIRSKGYDYLMYLSYPDGDNFRILLKEGIRRMIAEKGAIVFVRESTGFYLNYNGHSLEISIDDSNLSKGYNDTQLSFDLDKFIIELTKELYYRLNPERVFSHYLNDPIHLPPSDEELSELITGINIFSPKLVKKIGREKLLSSQVYKVEELKDGGILLLRAQNPRQKGPTSTKELSEYLFGKK